MDSLYRITRPAEPSMGEVVLHVHHGPRLRFSASQISREVMLSELQAASIAQAGWGVEPVTVPALKPWPFKMTPAEYVAYHEGGTDPSPAVRANLELARRHLAEQDEARTEPGGEG